MGMRSGWIAAASVIFALASAQLYAPLLGGDSRRAVPAAAAAPFATVDDWDRRFSIWLISNNARRLTERPHRPFDTGTCHPVESTLALGHPALSLGLLGVPAWIATRDPVRTYNATLVLQTLVSAFAMYLLVASWTRIHGAGIAAGTAYAFLPAKTGLVLYPFHGDTAWVLLACFFAGRLCRGSGFRDAVGFAAATTLQVAASFYTMLGTACIGGGVVAAFLLSRERRLRAAPIGLALFLAALGSLLVLAPYLSGESLDQRTRQLFGGFPMVWEQIRASPVVGLLAALALVLPGRLFEEPARNARWGLLVGGGSAAVLACVPTAWNALGALLPGLDNVRVPLLLLPASHLALCVLAGIGTAGLLRTTPESARTAATLVLMTVLGLDVLRPIPGWGERPAYTLADVRPPEAELDFYERLETLGDPGPLLEAPIDYATLRNGLAPASQAVLHQAYHGRRSSACYNSFIPSEVHEVGALASRLPDPVARRALVEYGFTTLVVRQSLHPEDRAWRRNIERASSYGLGLAPLARGEGLTAFDLRDP